MRGFLSEFVRLSYGGRVGRPPTTIEVRSVGDGRFTAINPSERCWRSVEGARRPALGGICGTAEQLTTIVQWCRDLELGGSMK